MGGALGVKPADHETGADVDVGSPHGDFTVPRIRTAPRRSDLTARVNPCLSVGFRDPWLEPESHQPGDPAAAVRP